MVGLIFFLSIPIPGFIPEDRFAWNGPLRLSFTARRNSSLRSSDTAGQWKKKIDDRQKRPGLQTRTPKTN